MNTNRSMPPGVIIPELPYTDVVTAADWLCQTFGFKKRLQIGKHRFQLSFGGASIVAIERKETSGNASIMVQVDDIDTHHAYVSESGARIINPPTDYPFGERQYTVEDPGGHRWTFSQTISDVDPKTWGGIFIMENNPDAEDFIRTYEQALATQDWRQVEPLIHSNACVTFSNGTVHKGKAEVQKAFERNFSLIKDETYSISNVYWVMKKPDTAVYLFEFNWSGIINEKTASGSGRGTCMLINEAGKWQLLIEHLGPRSA